MASTRISVVMSVYNGQEYLPEAVDSILTQTFRDFEFIIIDDGSVDKTAEILTRYAERDSRIRIISHENKGRAASLNIGIEAAKSEYIARMDADDVALPERLQQQFDFLETQPQVGIVGGAVELIKRNGSGVRRVQPPVSDSEIRTIMLQGNPMWHPAITMRRKVVIAAGGYRKQFLDADDYDLWLRMVELCQIANLGIYVLRYRIHANQVSVQNMRHQTMCVFAARIAAALRRSGKPDPLSEVMRITPSITQALGVNASEIDRKVADACVYWLQLFKDADETAALEMVEELLKLSRSAERTALCDACLTAAQIHYRHGRPGLALACAARAISFRPIVAGRPVKKAFTRLAAAISKS
ncbi:MAG TPA: glycosyltransferase [Candidatus Acidoferrales bacterium]|nr:glycosyltransferase [Candidatus Acidoferrales bacterium]